MGPDEAPLTFEAIEAQVARGAAAPEVSAAVQALHELSADFVNGGYDLVAWNHDADAVRRYAQAFRAVGAIENGELLDALAAALERHQLTHGELAIAADPVTHFHAFRRAVRGIGAGVPHPDDELAEVLVEYVITRSDALG